MDNRMVLIIDDCPLDGAILANLVEKAGGIPFVASTKELTSEMIDICKFDALTVDINLADGQKGHLLVKELGLLEAASADLRKVVAVTGEVLNPAQAEELIEMGFSAIFPKPFNANDLVKAIGL